MEGQEHTPTRQRAHKERDLETLCCNLARGMGFASWKNEPKGNKGIPDRSFLSPGGTFFFVEFKRDGRQHLREGQEVWRDRWPQLFHRIDNTKDFMALLRQVLDFEALESFVSGRH